MSEWSDGRYNWEEKKKVMHARILGKVSKDGETQRTADSKEKKKRKNRKLIHNTRKRKRKRKRRRRPTVKDNRLRYIVKLRTTNNRVLEGVLMDF